MMNEAHSQKIGGIKHEIITQTPKDKIILISFAFVIGVAYRLLMGVQGIDITDMGFCMTFYQNIFSHPDAMTFYLRAILAARMNEKAAVKDYLAQAIALDPSMAKRAANDAEFSDYNK